MHAFTVCVYTCKNGFCKLWPVSILFRCAVADALGSGLSAGEIAAIAIGTVLLLAVLVAVIATVVIVMSW